MIEVWIMIELWIMERQFKIDPIKTIPNNVERVQDLNEQFDVLKDDGNVIVFL
ncbi:hypothetical protein OAK32_02285 [Mariniblastus sp.]|nr:hypothetical protein [Mariniblastus sp.]